MQPSYGEKVLLVDDSQAITALLRARCEAVAGVTTESAGSLAEVMASIESDPDRFFLAVVDLNLPDAPDGEVVDYILAHDIPVGGAHRPLRRRHARAHSGQERR